MGATALSRYTGTGTLVIRYGLEDLRTHTDGYPIGQTDNREELVRIDRSGVGVVENGNPNTGTRVGNSNIWTRISNTT
jgi:hypothetical protein